MQGECYVLPSGLTVMNRCRSRLVRIRVLSREDECNKVSGAALTMM